MIRIDLKSSKPIYEQIIKEIKELIFKDIIRFDEKLPSVRELANILTINPNTVSRAYAELEKEGIVESKKGSGTYVKLSVKAISKEYRENRMKEAMKNLIMEADVLKYSKEEVLYLIERAFLESGGSIDA